MKTHLPITLVFILHSFFILQAQNFEIDTQLFASGLNQPLGIENVGDSRLFIPEKPGTISIVNANGSVEPTPFLDITNLVTTNGERGLLGLAFHPNYTTNGYFYVNYTNTSGNTVISRFSVSADNPNLADENTEIQLLTYNQPFTNHNGGDLTFGPDGMLYIASGDGGSGGDPGERAQSLNTLLGKILRLNVDIAAPYIPNNNPFVNDGDNQTLGEIWAYGLRNPFRISFDSANGDFWIGDVGQNEIEEINKVTQNPAAVNYGWRCFEGNSTYDDTSDCLNSFSPHTPPIIDYTQTNGRCSVTGGRVYRGPDFSNLTGVYIFADFCSGELASIDTSQNVNFTTPTNGSSFVGFGTNDTNMLFVADIGGSIYKIVDNIALGVHSQNDTPAITITPNPTQSSFNISLLEDYAQVEIFDISGQQVLQKRVNKDEAIQVSNLAEGLYIVRIISPTGKHSVKKLIKY
ncbi:PQQ-dependent sugar dehydrogenase [Croceibacter atlanticus]|uniref:PQQ-dependent sugar dehydrogenase n=1 Tax=Croceibacter atlanticus TaxID=313588 RepID=UPI0030FC5D0F